MQKIVTILISSLFLYTTTAIASDCYSDTDRITNIMSAEYDINSDGRRYSLPVTLKNNIILSRDSRRDDFRIIDGIIAEDGYFECQMTYPQSALHDSAQDTKEIHIKAGKKRVLQYAPHDMGKMSLGLVRIECTRDSVGAIPTIEALQKIFGLQFEIKKGKCTDLNGVMEINYEAPENDSTTTIAI